MRITARSAAALLALCALPPSLHARPHGRRAPRALAAPVAPVHRCAADARTHARRLLELHRGPDDRIAIDSQVRALAPLRNPGGGGALDVLEVRGYVYRATYRMRFLYAPGRGDCVLMGQEIFELARV